MKREETDRDKGRNMRVVICVLCALLVWQAWRPGVFVRQDTDTVCEVVFSFFDFEQ